MNRTFDLILDCIYIPNFFVRKTHTKITFTKTLSEEALCQSLIIPNVQNIRFQNPLTIR